MMRPRSLATPATASWSQLADGLAERYPLLARLSPAEQVVALHLRQGLSNREIAAALGKSLPTVRHQVGACLVKFGVPTRSRLIALLHQGHDTASPVLH